MRFEQDAANLFFQLVSSHYEHASLILTRTQAAARIALQQWRAAKPDDPKAPHRVYACDTCDGWHLTSKQSGRSVPAWDRNPDWNRTLAQLANLQPRFGR